MDALKQYVISVSTAAIICGVFTSMLRKGASHGLVKLLCGLFLAFTFIKPLGQLDITGFLEPVFDYSAAEDASQTGTLYAEESMAQIIKAEVEAYILDKAAVLEQSIEAEVILDEGELPLPVAVQITGQVSPYAKAQLETILEEELGIAKENQLWNG